MKYSQPNNLCKNITHQFRSDGIHCIGGKNWSNVDMTFREMSTRTDKREFMFTIRYGNPSDQEWQLNQFAMREDEIKQFLNIVNNTVNGIPEKPLPKKYIVFYDGRIGYVSSICKCERCIERGQFEWFINDLDDKYMDCIKPEDEIEEILYVGESLKDAIEKSNKYQQNKLDAKINELKFSEQINKVYRDSIWEVK